MKIKSIFEKVNLIHPIEQRKFFSFLDDVLKELISKYGEKFVLCNDAEASDGEEWVFYNDSEGIDGTVNVLPLYEKAIVLYILALCGAGDFITEAMRQAEQAYIYYYRLYGKNRRLKRKDR